MSGFFPAAPELCPVWHDGTTDGVNWYLVDDFVYNADAVLPFTARAITVPAQFCTDFASVPKMLQNIYGPWGKYGPAAIIHDWLYWDQSTTKVYADSILEQAMYALKVDPVTVRAIYEAVALGGQFAWDGNAKLKGQGFKRTYDPVRGMV
jgi:hypothetical protein